MGFASEYLSSRVLFEPFITSDPKSDTAIIVIIPAFDEPDIIRTLDSLAACNMPDCSIEVLVHVNASFKAEKPQLERNLETINKIESWNSDAKAPFRLFVFNSGISNSSDWGAGMARKVVMDEAASRFNRLDRPEGVIVSLDADCTVSKNYFEKIYSEIFLRPGINASSIYFEHPVFGTDFSPEIYNAIVRYELYLRYYYQALILSGFPTVFHTVGSAFCVKAGVYVKSGGMSRHQAGEDFYFIQKVIPMSGYSYLTGATVYPSPRISSRVPFGTGPAIRDILSNPTHDLDVYNPDAFICLRPLFMNIHKLYQADDKMAEWIENSLADNPLRFLIEEEWRTRISEINSNTSSQEAFTKRFFSWFNMFKVVKYLNWSHSEGTFRKVGVSNAALKLLGLMEGKSIAKDEVGLLEIFRAVEK